MQARGSVPSTQLDLVPEMQTFGSFYTLNKCFLIASVGLQVFLPEQPSGQAAKSLGLGMTHLMKWSLTATMVTRLPTEHERPPSNITSRICNTAINCFVLVGPEPVSE